MPKSVFPSLGVWLCLHLFQKEQIKLVEKSSSVFLLQLWQSSFSELGFNSAWSWQCHAGTFLHTKLSCSRVKWRISKQQCLQRGPVLPFLLVPNPSWRGKDHKAAPLTTGLARGSHPQDKTSINDTRNSSNFPRSCPRGSLCWQKPDSSQSAGWMRGREHPAASSDSPGTSACGVGAQQLTMQTTISSLREWEALGYRNCKNLFKNYEEVGNLHNKNLPPQSLCWSEYLWWDTHPSEHKAPGTGFVNKATTDPDMSRSSFCYLCVQSHFP